MKNITFNYNHFTDVEINNISKWVFKNRDFSQGDLNDQFEEKFSKEFGVKYSVFTNSGTSAVFLMLYSLLFYGHLKSRKIIIPSITGHNTISSALQIGYLPIVCDNNLENMGVNLEHLERTIKKESPDIFLSTNNFGISPDYKDIIDICDNNNVILITDNRQALGSTYYKSHLSKYGLMSAHSFSIDKNIYTLYGGMVCTDNRKLYNAMKTIRDNGSSEFLTFKEKRRLKNKFRQDEMLLSTRKYYAGSNFKNSSLSAYMGLSQLKKVNETINKRHFNFNLFQKNIKNNYWKIFPYTEKNDIISSHNYPILHPDRDNIIEILRNNNIECYPITTNENQPFTRYNKCIIENNINAKIIEKNGLILPNNPALKEKEIIKICDIINDFIN